MQRYKRMLFAFFLILWCLSATAKRTLKNEIHGLANPLLKNAIARFKVAQETHDENVTVEQIQQWYHQGPNEIKQSLQPYGYFNPQISSHLTQINSNNWIASYQVVPGPLTHVTKIDVVISGPGRNEKEFADFEKNMKIKVGDAFSSKKYNKAKTHLFDTANNLGYIKAQLILSKVKVNTDKHTAEIILFFDTGIRYYYGKIAFNKNPFADKFLQRFISIKPGQPYNTDQILHLQQDLNNSDYFQQVNIHALHKKIVDQQIPIHIDVTPYNAKQYLTGLGYGTDTGVRGTLGFNFRRVTNTGQQFRTYLQASRIQTTLEAKYLIPGYNPITDQFVIGAGIRDMYPPRSTSHTEQVNLSYITNHKVWQSTYGLVYQRDKFSILGAPTQKTTTVYPTVTLLRISTNDPIRTYRGYRVNLNVRGSTQLFGSDLNFVQSQINSKLIYSFTNYNRIVLRGDLGYTIVNRKSELAPSFLFYAGGAASVRGYDYQSLGPGRLMLVGSAELQQRIYDNIYLGVFYDTGNASNNFDLIRVNHLPKSAGAGIIWMTPIGPIEVSVAKPIKDPLNRKFKIQFSMGPDL